MSKVQHVQNYEKYKCFEYTLSSGEKRLRLAGQLAWFEDENPNGSIEATPVPNPNHEEGSYICEVSIYKNMSQPRPTIKIGVERTPASMGVEGFDMPGLSAYEAASTAAISKALRLIGYTTPPEFYINDMNTSHGTPKVADEEMTEEMTIDPETGIRHLVEENENVPAASKKKRGRPAKKSETKVQKESVETENVPEQNPNKSSNDNIHVGRPSPIEIIEDLCKKYEMSLDDAKEINYIYNKKQGSVVELVRSSTDPSSKKLIDILGFSAVAEQKYPKVYHAIKILLKAKELGFNI